jgi:hypothetical protein
MAAIENSKNSGLGSDFMNDYSCSEQRLLCLMTVLKQASGPFSGSDA